MLWYVLVEFAALVHNSFCFLLLIAFHLVTCDSECSRPGQRAYLGPRGCRSCTCSLLKSTCIASRPGWSLVNGKSSCPLHQVRYFSHFFFSLWPLWLSSDFATHFVICFVFHHTSKLPQRSSLCWGLWPCLARQCMEYIAIHRRLRLLVERFCTFLALRCPVANSGLFGLVIRS